MILKLSKKQNSILLFSISAILLLYWLIDLKNIYWGILDFAIFFSGFNLIFFILYILFNFLGFTISFLLLFKPTFLNDLSNFLSARRFLTTSLVIFLSTVPALIFTYSDWGNIFLLLGHRIPILIYSLFSLCYILFSMQSEKNWQTALVIALILTGFFFAIGIRARRIISYPFSLKWSEGNRFWDYSIFLAKDKYQFPQGIQPSVLLDFGRISLWGIIFLIPDLSIRSMRLWNDLLFILPHVIFVLILFWTKVKNYFLLLLLGIFGFLFFNQGPIYTPIIISALLVVLASRTKMFPGLLIMILSGYYAQLTRYTWIAAPSIWISLLIIDKVSQEGNNKNQWNFLPYALAGFIGSIIVPIFFQINIGLYQQSTDSTFSFIDFLWNTLSNQALIWGRLLPNSTNNLGILGALFYAVLPLFLLIVVSINKRFKFFSFLQKAILIFSLAFNLVIGIFVSLKIGGGNNLHNFDLLFITIIFIAYLYWENILEFLKRAKMKKNLLGQLLIFILFLLPFQKEFVNLQPLILPDEQIQKQSLEKIQATINDEKYKENVLFIDQRQLLTFGFISYSPMNPEYEKKLLMNEALSNNSAYFEKFYFDLRNKKYSLIINKPINIIKQNDEFSFGEENDAYVKWVSGPLFCFYEQLETFNEIGIELLVPRETPLINKEYCPEVSP